MMNKKGDFNIQGMIFGMLVAGLFFSLFGQYITMLSGSYDTTGFIQSDIDKFNKLENLSVTINKSSSLVDTTTVDKNVFDYIADIFSKLLTPFKFIYQSFYTLISLSTSAVGELGLLSVIGDFFVTLITLLVIIGIVMIKFYLGRQK